MKRHLLRSLFADTSDDTEDRTKFIQKRIQLIQKYIPALNNTFSDYINKTAGIMDSSDKIALVLENYAKSETVTIGLKQRLIDYSNILNQIDSKRDYQIKSMEENILQELASYKKMCKHVQSEIKCYTTALEKERIRWRQLKRAQAEHLSDGQQIAMAEAEFTRARSDSSRAALSLEEQIDIFERRRLNGLREVLLSWTLAELRFHAKALELFTEAYNVASNINVESDMEEFRNKLKSENSPRIDSSRDNSFQGTDSLINLISVPSRRSRERLTGIGIPHPSPSSNMSPRISDLNDYNHSCIF